MSTWNKPRMGVLWAVSLFLICLGTSEARSADFVKLLGTSSDETGRVIAVDSSGNSYVTGSTLGGLDGLTNSGSDDIFIAKYNSSGTKQWVKLLGTAGSEFGYGIAVDSSGNSYITGYTDDNLDGVTNAGGLNDIFIAKYNSSGTKQWVKLLGTTGDEGGNGIAVDSSGNAYVTGYSDGGLDGQVNAGGTGDVFIAKYDTNGTKQWVRLLGTTGFEQGVGIAVDSSGNAYVTGNTDGNLDGVTNSGGIADIFIAKYNTSGTKQWVKLLGTTGDDEGKGIAVDSSGNSYVTGNTDGNLDGLTNAGLMDIFIAKYDTSGNKQWVKLLGTASVDQGAGIAVDSSGNSYVTGNTDGNLDGQSYAGGVADIVLAKYNTAGVKQSVTLLGTSDEDVGLGVGVLSDGSSAFVTGQTAGNLGGQTNAGNADIVIWKKEFISSATATPTSTPTPTATATPTATNTPPLVSVLTWVSRTSGITNILNGVTYGNGTFVAVGYSGTILTSTNGTSWSKVTFTTTNLFSVAFENNTFVATGPGGTILTSPDGSTWTSRNSGATGSTLFSVAYGNNTFVAVGSSETILTSPDGSTWTSRNSGTTSILFGVGYGNNTFVAVGESGKILTSPDGSTWTSRNSGTTSILFGVGYGNNTFVVVGSSGTILTSSDNGTSWSSSSSGTTSYLNSVGFGNNTFVAVGEGGTILTRNPNWNVIQSIPTVPSGTPTPFATIAIESGALSGTSIGIPAGEMTGATINIAEVENVPQSVTGGKPAKVLALKISDVSGCVSGITISVAATGGKSEVLVIWINNKWIEVPTTLSSDGKTLTGFITCAQLSSARASDKSRFGFDRAASDIVIVGLAEQSLVVPSLGRVALVLLLMVLTGLMIRSRYRVARNDG